MVIVTGAEAIKFELEALAVVVQFWGIHNGINHTDGERNQELYETV